MQKKLNVEQIVSYSGHSLTAAGAVNITFSSRGSELPVTLQLTAMIANNISLTAKKDGKKIIVGTFSIKSININRDGISKIKLTGTTESVDMDALNKIIPSVISDVSDMRVIYECTVVLDDAEEKEETEEAEPEETDEDWDELEGEFDAEW